MAKLVNTVIGSAADEGGDIRGLQQGTVGIIENVAAGIVIACQRAIALTDFKPGSNLPAIRNRKQAAPDLGLADIITDRADGFLLDTRCPWRRRGNQLIADNMARGLSRIGPFMRRLEMARRQVRHAARLSLRLDTVEQLLVFRLTEAQVTPLQSRLPTPHNDGVSDSQFDDMA